MHQYQPTEDEDLLDRFPAVGRATTQLERSFGPSCLLSMIFVLLITVLTKRYFGVSWIALSVLSVVIWFLVLNLLVRWRPDRIVDDD